MNTERQLTRFVQRVLREELEAQPVPTVGFKRLRPEENDLPLPTYQTPMAVGMDLQACLPEREIKCVCAIWSAELRAREKCTRCNTETGIYKVRNVTLDAHGRMAIPTGFAYKLGWGWEGQIRSRSGLALKEGVIVLNAPGTVDPDYTGEVKVILFNTTGMPFIVEHGMRIAQLVIQPVFRAATEEVQDLPATQRGDGGFGHTGT